MSVSSFFQSSSNLQDSLLSAHLVSRLWDALSVSISSAIIRSEFTIAGIMLLVILVAATLLVGRTLLWRKIERAQTYVFLGLVFPASNDKTAYATEQLFTLLHNLSGHRNRLHELLNYKKPYSLEIVATREQGIRYILVAPTTDAQIIRMSLLSYLPGLRICEIEDYLPSVPEEMGSNFGVVELGLSRNYVLPLQKHKSLDEHDPIAYLTGSMTKLSPGETMVFQTVITPAGRLDHVKEISHKIYNNEPLSDILLGRSSLAIIDIPWALVKGALIVVRQIIMFALSMVIASWDTKGDTVPFLAKEKPKDKTPDIQNPYEQQLRTIVKEKISQPLFEVSLRLFVKSDSLGQFKSRVSSFLASMGTLSSPYQSLVVKNRGLFALRQNPVADFAARQVSPNAAAVLSTSELTDIYHFPYAETTRTEDLVKSKNSPLPAPLSYKQEATKFDNVFAKNNYGGSITKIGQILEERRRHTYILGATGSGKTTLLTDMIYQDIINGKGVAVLDPHGELIEKILKVIPEDRINDVVWFAPDDNEFPIALNLLDLPDKGELSESQLQKQKSLVASSIISIIQKFYDAKFFGPRMEYVLRNAVLTALETEDPTLQTILDILTKGPVRSSIIRGLNNKVLKDYWVFEFEKLGVMQRNSVISPITNRIGGLLSSPINYNILTQAKSKLDFNEVINNKKILLCDLSKGKIGEDESSFFGSLIIAKIQLAALKRVLIPEEERQDFYLYVDEFQNFATPTFAELVSEARKYRLATILAHQSISQIENRDIVKVILVNVGTIICFRTANPEDEQFILPTLAPEVTKHEISNLPLYNFYMKVSVGKAQDTFLAEADNFTERGSEEIAEEVKSNSREKYATPFEKTPTPALTDAQSMRRSMALNASQAVKKSETVLEQFTGSEEEESGLYPIQDRSKAGNGKVSINKQKIISKIQTINITPQQQEILSLLFRFRFLNRTQIQQLLDQKNHKRILLRLNQLADKELIKAIPGSNNQVIYCLASGGVNFLSLQASYDKQALDKYRHENKRSTAFISRCLFIADTYLKLREQGDPDKGYDMQVTSDYPQLETTDLLVKLAPEALITDNSTKTKQPYFMVLLKEEPLPRLRKRIVSYLYSFQSSDWQEATGEEFPIVLIVSPKEQIKKYALKYIKRKMKELELDELKIRLTTQDKVKQSGLTGDIWEDIN